MPPRPANETPTHATAGATPQVPDIAIHPISSVPAYDPGGSPWDLLKPNPGPAEPSAPVQTSVSQSSEITAPLPSVVTPSAPSVEPPPTVVATPLNREDGDLVKFLSNSLFTSKRPPAPAEGVPNTPAHSASAPAVVEKPMMAATPVEEPGSIADDLLTEQPGAAPGDALVEPLADKPSTPSASADTPLPVAADRSLQRRYGPASPELSAAFHSVPPRVASEPPPGRAAHWRRWLAAGVLGVAGLAAALGAARSWRSPSPPAPDSAQAAPPEPSPPAAQSIAAPVVEKVALPAEQPALSAEPVASATGADAAAPQPQADISLVTLTVSPPDAMISRPGDEPRRSPAAYHLEKGDKVVVSVSCWGYLSRTVVLDGSSPDVTVTLARAPGSSVKGGRSDQARAGGAKQNAVPTRRFDPLP